MGVSELRDAFNAVAQPQYTAHKALLGYEQAHDVEWQRIAFIGTDQAGNPFTYKSELLRPETHLVTAAADTARTLLSNPPKVTP